MKKRTLAVIGCTAAMTMALAIGAHAEGLKFGYTYWAASDFFSTIGASMQEIAEEDK